ncbi:hypothetical protein [Pandoraea terrae]|uniref:hypothetical protein n=1 Tax=Pandoraea terrae TaxID=1537710 RepID=UPI001242094A|nr:hypothetical protein [Pandoraea terrae]
MDEVWKCGYWNEASVASTTPNSDAAFATADNVGAAAHDNALTNAANSVRSAEVRSGKSERSRNGIVNVISANVSPRPYIPSHPVQLSRKLFFKPGNLISIVFANPGTVNQRSGPADAYVEFARPLRSGHADRREKASDLFYLATKE